MKALIIVLLAISLLSANSKPIFVPKDSVDDIKSYFLAIVYGFDLINLLKPNEICVNASSGALDYAAAGIDNFVNQNFWEGTLNISDSLGELSPVSRQCDEPFSALVYKIEEYPKQFDNSTVFAKQFVMNALGNLKPLLDRYIFVSNYLINGNTSAVIQTVAEIISIHLSINPIIQSPIKTDEKSENLNYTYADPLAPNPVSDNIWNVFESIYNLLVDSKFISEKNLVQCEGGALNMLLYNLDASSNFNSNRNKQGLQSVFDSFQYLHQSIEGCTYTLIEIGERSKLIDKEVFEKPSVIFKNILDNIFEILSDGLFGYAEIQYQDIISFFSAVGDFFYRTIVYGVDSQ